MLTDNTKIKVYGNVVISTPQDKFTVGDVRDFLKVLDNLGVKDDVELLDGYLTYEYQTTLVDVILCGEHKVGEEVYDFLINTHKCAVTGENNG